MLFSEYMREIRKSKGMTQAQLSRVSGVSAAQLSRIELGQREIPKPKTIKQISTALDVSYDEMMNAAGYVSSMATHENDELMKLFSLLDKNEKDLIINLIKTFKGINTFEVCLEDNILKLQSMSYDEVLQYLNQYNLPKEEIMLQLERMKMPYKKYDSKTKLYEHFALQVRSLRNNEGDK